MIIMEAEILLENVYNSEELYINSEFKCEFEINNVACTALIQSKKNEPLLFNKKEIVTITMPIGECLLVEIINNKRFGLYHGKKVGEGDVINILEVYVEKDNLNLVKKLSDRIKIIEIAKQLENALIFEDALDCIKGSFGRD